MSDRLLSGPSSVPAWIPASAPQPHVSSADEGGIDIAAVAGVAIGVGSQTRPAPRPRLTDRTSRPLTVVANYQALAAPTTYGFLAFPAVTPGKIWEIMRIGVTGSDPFTTLAGVSVLAFRSAYVPQDSATEPATFGDLIAVLGSVPNTSYPAFHSTVARQSERVVLAFKSLAALQQIQASMDVIEHDLQCYLAGLLGT